MLVSLPVGSLPRPLSGLSLALTSGLRCLEAEATEASSDSLEELEEVTTGLLETTPGGDFQIAAWLLGGSDPGKVGDFFMPG